MEVGAFFTMVVARPALRNSVSRDFRDVFSDSSCAIRLRNSPTAAVGGVVELRNDELAARDLPPADDRRVRRVSPPPEVALLLARPPELPPAPPPIIPPVRRRPVLGVGIIGN